MSKATCRCCLLLPSDKDLRSKNDYLGETEVYADMLKECFEIQFNNTDKDEDCGICDECIKQLRTSYNFKKQVLKCQKEFETLKNGEVKVETQVKIENVNADDEDDGPFFLDYTDLKEELSDLDKEDDDDKNLALLAIEQMAKRKSAKKSKLTSKKCARSKMGTKILDTPINLRDRDLSKALWKNISDITKHSSNLDSILKNSNATPFSNKTLHGFVCAYCKDALPELNDLRLHIKEKHSNDKLDYSKKRDGNSLSVKLDITDLKCNICLKTFDVISNLKTHLTKEHDIKFFPDVKDYILEFKLTNSDILNCALCNSTYETFKMLLQHMNGHYRNFICQICDCGFINNQRLKNHMRTHETGNFKCSFCEKVFTTPTKKACHEKYTHKNGARYQTNCPHCNQSFTSYYQRNRHMTQVHNTAAASYRCNICDRDFLLKSKLTYHIKKIHLMERNHKCDECGQGFFMKQYLEEHMIKHKGERIHKCTVCSKAYARKKTLREHMRIHNNDRRFKCGFCGLTFVQKCSLKSHMLSNHGVTLTEFENSRMDVESRSSN